MIKTIARITTANQNGGIKITIPKKKAEKENLAIGDFVHATIRKVKMEAEDDG